MPSVIYNLEQPIKSGFIKKHLRKEAREFLGLGKWSSRAAVRKSFEDKFIRKAALSYKEQEAFLNKLNTTQVYLANINNSKQHVHLAIMDMFKNVENAILGLKSHPTL